MDEKKADDFSGLADLLAAFSREMKENPIISEQDFEYPIEVTEIEKRSFSLNQRESGKLVKVRPCADQHGNKTYLGIYLGDFPVSIDIGLFTKTNKLSILSTTNPAIFVPELKKVIFGYESWWGEIESEEELKEITDNDIDNVWYVQLLKSMSKDTDGLETGTAGNKIS